MLNTAAPFWCLRQGSCASRWQPIPTVQCRYILCRAAAKHDVESPRQDSQTHAYNEVLVKYLDEVSGERETGAEYSRLCMRMSCAHWLHVEMYDELQQA